MDDDAADDGQAHYQEAVERFRRNDASLTTLV
jgi:hypothetical protein